MTQCWECDNQAHYCVWPDAEGVYQVYSADHPVKHPTAVGDLIPYCEKCAQEACDGIAEMTERIMAFKREVYARISEGGDKVENVIRAIASLDGVEPDDKGVVRIVDADKGNF